MVSLGKFSLLLGLCVVALVFGLRVLKGPGVFTLDRISGPRLPLAEPANVNLANASPTPAPDPVEVVKPAPLPTKSLSYGSGSGTPPPSPELYHQSGPVSPEKVAVLRAAIDAITVIGCSGGRAAVQVSGEPLRTISSGSVLHLPGRLNLAARIVDTSRCRIVLFDHGRAIGEVASF